MYTVQCTVYTVHCTEYSVQGGTEHYTESLLDHGTTVELDESVCRCSVPILFLHECGVFIELRLQDQEGAPVLVEREIVIAEGILVPA